MYNRYIPQPDGSFRRNRLPDKSQIQEQTEPQLVIPTPSPEPAAEPASMPTFFENAPKRCHPRHDPPRRKPATAAPPQASSISGFFRRLLPKEFDTGDLIIVLLLLLIAGDCTEDQNTALLTLALYFFM